MKLISSRFLFHALFLSFLSLATLLLSFSSVLLSLRHCTRPADSPGTAHHDFSNHPLKLASSPAHHSSPASSDSCAGRKIYMYDLPPSFNAQILHQCHYQIAHWIDFCPHVLNHGFGKPATYASNCTARDCADWADWFETDFYMLEVIFHSRMAVYPCRTDSARDADAFFVPYYTGLDALHYLYGDKRKQSSEHGKELVRWLMEYEGGAYWRRRSGRDHFIMMGRTAWDFTRMPLISTQAPTAEDMEGDAASVPWGTSIAVMPELQNVTALFIERRPWASLEQAIPYPTGFHPATFRSLLAWQDKVRAAKRRFLMAFVGAPRPLESSTSERRLIRQSAIDECMKDSSVCTLIDCRKMQCETESVQIAKQMLDANFCLQPPGDTPTRRSAFDGLLAGCIPVFFDNDSAYTQYTWHLPPHDDMHPSSYSVFVPSGKIPGLSSLLSSFSTERIAQMRSFIVEHVIPQIIYVHPHLASSNPNIRDAFQVTVDTILRKVATYE